MTISPGVRRPGRTAADSRVPTRGRPGAHRHEPARQPGRRGIHRRRFLRVDCGGVRARAGHVWVVVRDVGPAGGRIQSLEWDAAESCLQVNGCLKLVLERPQAACHVLPPDGRFDSPMALLEYDVDIPKGGVWRLALRAEHGFAERAFPCSTPSPHRALSVRDGMARCAAQWESALPARVFAPDMRIARTWEQCGIPFACGHGERPAADRRGKLPGFLDARRRHDPPGDRYHRSARSGAARGRLLGADVLRRRFRSRIGCARPGHLGARCTRVPRA